MKERWVFLIAFTLVIYGTGAAFIESFVNYPSWHLIGAADFAGYHRFITPRVVAFLVAPTLLGTAFTILLLRFRPASVPRAAVWTAITLQTIAWISTATVQVPMQMQFSAGNASIPLIDHLIETNFWFRRVPYGLCVGLFLWMASRVMRAAGDGRTD